MAAGKLMNRIRTVRPKARRERPWLEDLPPDPRDPDVVTRVIAAGRWHGGDPDMLAVLDSGYDLTRLARLLADLPLEITGRLRGDRVMYFPVPPRGPGTTGRPARRGAA